MVNNGAERAVVIKGLPTNSSGIKVYATNQEKEMEEIHGAHTSGSDIQIQLPPMSFVSVFLN